MNFMDLVAVNLVSYIVIIAGLFGVSVISCWRLGRVVLSDDAFQVVMCVLWLEVWISQVLTEGVSKRVGGWEYSLIGSLHFNVSLSKISGRYGNLLFMVCKFRGSFVVLINLYISLLIDLGGLMICWFVILNWMYGCGYLYVFQVGFAISPFFLIIELWIVQSGSRIYISMWSQVSNIGLIVVMIANNILGGGWCRFWYMYRDKCG